MIKNLRESCLRRCRKEFYAKWDYCHLHDLKDAQWQEVIDDIEMLKQRYNYIEEISDTFAGGIDLLLQ